MAMIKARVEFNRLLRVWDGFGVNYVETCQTPDYQANPQDYGGFSTLSEAQRQEILDQVFGEEGLKPGLVKMFFDGLHQDEAHVNPADPFVINMANYDHKTTTPWIRYFAREGLKRTRSRGDDLTIVTSLYGPPAFMTKQKFVRGRDLDPAYKVELAKYYISWVKFLREQEGLPVKYISLHNEGEDWRRWNDEGTDSGLEHGHDYNMWWTPELTAEFIAFMQPMIDSQGMPDVSVTPGECTNWLRFHQWGYADAIADNEDALRNLGLITSHGFFAWSWSRWFADDRSAGIDILREKRPELHAWVTSTSWRNMDAHFVNEFRLNIYSAKVNGLIPWACIQSPALWKKGDPNPGCAFRVDGKGGYTVEPGYYFYKGLCRAGQPGTAVARVRTNDSELNIAAFASNGTHHPDAFVVINTSGEDKSVDIQVLGGGSATYAAFRTSPSEQYISLGEVRLNGDEFTCTAPAGSVTAYFAK